MKANLTGSVDKMREELWQASQRSNHISKAILILAMSEHFGIGKKRMTRFLRFYNDFVKQFIEYEHDGIQIDMINEGLKKFGTSFETLFANETYKEAVRGLKRQESKRKIEYADAVTAQKKLKQYAGYVGEVNRNVKQ